MTAAFSAQPAGWAENARALPYSPPSGSATRPEIAESWKRSAMCGLERDQEVALPYRPVAEATDRLTRSAAPVLDDLGALLAGSSTAVMLAGGQGRLVHQRCEEQVFARRLERVNAVPGYVWQEQYAATNAVGLALEVQALSWVDGHEHYLERLSPFACAATPIVHPLTQRLQGVLALVTGAGADVRLMLSTVQLLARAVAQRLYEQSSAAERLLLSRFLAKARRSDTPVLATCQGVELANPAAARLLGAEEKALLFERAADAVSSRTAATTTVSLAGRGELSAQVERLEGPDRAPSLIIVLGDVPSRAAGGRVRRAASENSENLGFVGRTDSARHLREQARHLATHRLPVCVSGEPGTGKLTLARSIATRMPDTRPPVVIEAAQGAMERRTRALRAIADALEQRRATVIVRHVECLGADGLRMLNALGSSAEAEGSRLLLTRTTPARRYTWPELAGPSTLELLVPPLREHIDDLLDLVPFLIARRGSTVHAPPALMRALIRYDWPGNVAELDCVVRDLLSRARGMELSVDDLPACYHGSGRRLGRMEHVERAAILRALQEANGSKSRAAEVLGIGRATLYRKIRSYALDLTGEAG